MASARVLPNSQDIDKKFFCPVCLEILQNPTKILCGHTFCANCLDSCIDANSSVNCCPVCRAGFNPRRRMKEAELERELHLTMGACQDCGREFILSGLRAHRAVCSRTGTSLSRFTPVSSTSQPTPSVENRSTFKCPYCREMNLDTSAMLEHVNNNHKHENIPVVCPICASMPWGNPQQQSGNFIQHLNRRHKFEYDTFVDFHQGEDEVFERVLEQSMMER